MSFYFKAVGAKQVDNSTTSGCTQLCSANCRGERVKKNMSETLEDSKASMLFTNRDDATLKELSVILCNEYKTIVSGDGAASNSAIRNETVDVFEKLESENKVNPLIT